MNKLDILNVRGPLENNALRILREIPGVTAERNRRPDVVIRAGDVMHVVEVKTQRIANAAAARHLAEYARQLPKRVRLLLIAQIGRAHV